MRARLSAAVLAVPAMLAGLAMATAQPAGGRNAPPPGALACGGCHPPGPGAEVPPIAGMPAPQLAAAMRAFRSGERPATVMDRIANGFSDGEIDALAGWFARETPR